ncbi:MAG: 30S ribosomal protein S7, partial [Candidatus Thermoplasmatota archaeon]|nr:30S ribosomal protein S7 [Candidatus Thermoplasmatota archaeon]
NLANRFTVHTGGRHANQWFGKSELNLVERFVNQLMRTGRYSGKKSKALGAVEDAFDLIHERTEQNPLQVLVDAIQNSAPREEVTRLRYGGISVPKAVDTAPSRRVDWALRHLAKGSISSTYKNKKGIAQCVADELLKASRGDQESFAVGKRDEVERVAGSAR